MKNNYIATKELNKELNGIELYFSVYPLAGTKETLKKYGFRWNRKKACWYANQSEDTLYIANVCAETTLTEYKNIAKQTGEEVTEIKTAKADKKAPKKAETKQDIINLEGLGENRPHLYGAELAAAIREDLKKRGVTGVTVRADKVTHDTGITVTIKATENDIASVEEMKKRYPYSLFTCKADRGFYNGKEFIYNFFDLSEEARQEEYNNYIHYELSKVSGFSTYHTERKGHPELTTAFYNKCLAVFKIANQWNYNHSDSMTDYFDIGYFLDIDIKKPADFVPRENMTEAEREAYKEEQRQEEIEKAERIAQYEREQEEARKAHEAYETQRKIDRDVILNNITVEDLAEGEQIYITNLVGGIGKECNIDELNEEIERSPHYSEALITRKVIFTTLEAYEAFTKYLLDDFEFLACKGGTASEDVRLEGVDNPFYRLNEEQRENIKLFMNDCVAFYYNDELLLVSDPEGYSYSRYTYKPTAETKVINAKEETNRQQEESKAKTPFYFPEKVEVQADNIKIGQKITIYQTDGWNLCSVYGGFGEVTAIINGNYAQYNGVYITLRNGRKEKQVFIRDNKKCLIYEGIKPLLPDSITKRYISGNMYELLNSEVVFPAILDYYKEKPILDTIQR